MDPPDALEECLRRLAAGDLGACDTIVEISAGRLRQLARRLLARFPDVRRFDDTDDVFQGAAMRLHRALGELARSGQPPRCLMALAATQIHRELVDLARRHAAGSSAAANHVTNSIPGGDGSRQVVDEAVAGEEPLDRWEAFHAAVERLPPEERETFRLVWYVGADQRTIAGLMGCSERTVKSRWRQAREAVKAALEGDRPE